MKEHIDLFSGIGGFALAAHWVGYKTRVFCEQEKFCQQVLNKHWPSVPIVSDIRDFDGIKYTGASLLTGGFPCQPFSCAGKQRGHKDDRFLWPEMLRVISEAKPRWIVGENVAGIIGMALDGVLSDLEAEGYETQAFVLPACAVNAPHRRNRVWIVANTHERRRDAQSLPCAFGLGRENHLNFEQSSQSDEAVAHASRIGGWCRDKAGIKREETAPGGEAMADTPQFTQRESANQTDTITTGRRTRHEFGNGSQSIFGIRGQSESRLGGMADGLPGRLDGYFDCEPTIPRVAKGIHNRAARLKALGNAIVPQVAYHIIKYISSLDGMNK